MKYIAIPDLGYSDETLENLFIAILRLEDKRGLKVAVFPRYIEFVDRPYVLLRKDRA